ncbi:MAG: ATP-binding protein [Myxococcota bacterium]|nr:ATP-binding protein [Myxococcota bacterium]
MDLETTAASARSFLIVDDNQGFLDLIENFILRHYPSAEVGVASRGEEALNKLASQDWDVVLLDYRLPDFDGLEVLAEIRKRLVDVAVVVITGEGDERLAADLFRMGAYDYLVKGSIDPVSLRRCLDQVLMRRALEEQIRSQSGDLANSSLEVSERSRALDTAYEKLRQKKEELRFLSDSLETTVNERTAELRATTAFLNTVLDSASRHFIIATGEDGIILTFNRGAESAFGLTADQVVSNRHFSTLFAEDQEAEGGLPSIIDRCQKEGGVELEQRGIRADGEHFVARLSFSPLRGAGVKGIGGMVIVGLDINHERELEQKNQAYIRQIEMANLDLRRKNNEILQANRLKSAFLANVSHELRTPLNAVIGYADLLSQGIYGSLEQRQQEAVEGVATRAQDLLNLINDILDLAKIEAGRVDLKVEEFPLAQLMTETVETARVLAVDKPLEITWNHQGEALSCCTDRQKLQQILLNLVNNAVKFTQEGSIAILTSAVDDDEVLFSVRDSGIGIPESDLAVIFDEFRQGDGTATRQFGGTGLGLAISHKFAGHLGGELSAESRLGKGSLFSLRIPRVLQPVSQGDTDGAPGPVTLDSAAP